MQTRKKNKIAPVKKIAWTDTLKSMRVNDFIEADILDRPVIANTTSKLKREACLEFIINKVSELKIRITRIG